MTVYDLENRMSNAEFVRWSIYFSRNRQREELAEKMAAHQKG